MLSPKSQSVRAFFSSLTIRHLWLATPVFLILLKGFIFPLPLLDFWWHLRMGQYIYETLSIPRVDIFSSTAAGSLFIVQNWLAEIWLYLVYIIGGFPLLIFFNSILLVCILLPIFVICRKLSKSLGAILFSTCMIAICIPGTIRPQVFSFVLFSVFYWQLMAYRNEQRRWIWLLPGLMILWVNLHGAFIVGLGLIGLFILSESVRSFSRRCPDALGKAQLGLLALVFIACTAATLANPEGYKIYDYILTVVKDQSSQQLVVEWQPPAVDNIQGVIPFYLPFFLLTLVFISSERRPTLTEIALYAGFSAFGLTAIRNSVWFLLIAAPLMAKYLPFVNWSLLFLRPQSHRELSDGQMPARKKQNVVINYIIAIAALGILCYQSPWIRQHTRPGSLLQPGTPVGAMNFIEKQSLKGNIYHPQIYGDYLIWRLWPEQRSFFDGRVHLFGESFVRFYGRIAEDSNWEQMLEQYQVRYLLMAKDKTKPKEAKMIGNARKSPEWKLLYEDEISVLYEKTSQPENNS